MLLTIETTGGRAGTPATDLGHLLHKHPDRVQHFDTPSGQATVLYPIADADRCRVALRVAADKVSTRTLGDTDRHVNDLAYSGSSRLAVALGKVFADALRGTCRHRPDLLDTSWDLTVVLHSVPGRRRRDASECSLLPARVGGDLGGNRSDTVGMG